MQRLLCTRCGDSIHPDTAARNNGLCMPCVNGNQLTIQERTERHRQQREAERAFRESPAHKYWVALVDRVYNTPAGFEGLPHGDRLYYLLSVLTGEVHNGGFDQFFSNSSGKHYAETVSALTEASDVVSLQLLQAAKDVLFGQQEVPIDRRARFEAMATSSEDLPGYDAAYQALDTLDRRFWENAENIDTTLTKIASIYRLYGEP